ncbi:MAG: ATP-binding protein [Flavobacteriaceae bacterium]
MGRRTKFFEKIGRAEWFEIRSSCLILLMVAPGLYIYSILIGAFDPNRVEITGARELFAMLFLVGGLMPFFKREWAKDHYGHVIFFLMMAFGHYLIHTCYLNQYGLHYLLGTYVVLFGGILLLTDRFYILAFVTTSLLHMALAIYMTDVGIMEKSSIIMSLSTIFFFSFIIQNGFLKYKKKLKIENYGLEEKVRLRTKDLEMRAKELSLKNRELEEFAYVVSHDLKRPLRNAHSLAKWVEDDIQMKQYQSGFDNLALLKEQISQMDLLISGILDYSLGIDKQSSKTLVNVDDMVEKLISTNTYDNVLIQKDICLPKLFMDKAQLLQVFQNLVQNAIKYNDKEQAFVYIGCSEYKDRFQFYVRDNGPGIAKEHHERIFKLFQRLQETSDKNSSGIGLAVVKKIIDKNGGEISLKSKMGTGTTFYITLYKEDVLTCPVAVQQNPSIVYS